MPETVNVLPQDTAGTRTVTSDLVRISHLMKVYVRVVKRIALDCYKATQFYFVALIQSSG